MTISNADIGFTCGDSLVIAFTLTGTMPDGSALETADLEGATAKWWLGRTEKASGTNLLLEKDATIDATNLKATVVLNPADTQDVPPNLNYHHQLKVFLADGVESTTTKGRVSLLPTMDPIA
jgi:hypothetical protein